MTLVWGQFWQRYLSHQSLKLVWKLFIQNFSKISQGPMSQHYWDVIAMLTVTDSDWLCRQWRGNCCWCVTCLVNCEQDCTQVMCGDQWPHRADSRPAPSQWEMSLQRNTSSHWLGANLKSTLPHDDYKFKTERNGHYFANNLFEIHFTERKFAFGLKFHWRLSLSV